MSARIFIFNGSGNTEKHHFASDGFPFVRNGEDCMRFLVRKLPSSENPPCGRVTVSYRKGQQYVTLARLEREFEEQRMERIEAAMARGDYDGFED